MSSSFSTNLQATLDYEKRHQKALNDSFVINSYTQQFSIELNGNTYTVILVSYPGTSRSPTIGCSCPDFTFRCAAKSEPCKHIIHCKQVAQLPNRPACAYGVNCTRLNKNHLQAYEH